jgi:hypothetical protein
MDVRSRLPGNGSTLPSRRWIQELTANPLDSDGGYADGSSRSNRQATVLLPPWRNQAAGGSF